MKTKVGSKLERRAGPQAPGGPGKEEAKAKGGLRAEAGGRAQQGSPLRPRPGLYLPRGGRRLARAPPREPPPQERGAPAGAAGEGRQAPEVLGSGGGAGCRKPLGTLTLLFSRTTPQVTPWDSYLGSVCVTPWAHRGQEV